MNYDHYSVTPKWLCFYFPTVMYLYVIFGLCVAFSKFIKVMLKLEALRELCTILVLKSVTTNIIPKIGPNSQLKYSLFHLAKQINKENYCYRLSLL